MRVISGICKGKHLKAVPGKSTRPTTDKVKETIFNVIGPYFDGGAVLDLFAGSGGLGIEALSRGAEQVIFVDRDKEAIRTIKNNIDICGVEEKCEVYRNDAERALKALVKREIQFDYIFLDPPYQKQQLEKVIQLIDKFMLLSSKGMIICEHSTGVVLPDEIGSFVSMRKGDFGTIGLHFYHGKNE